MSKSDEETKSSSEKKSNAEKALIEVLKNSATQEAQNKATNKRIDKIDGHMIVLVDKMTTLAETSIRREESDIRAEERGDRLEKSNIELIEKVDIVEKQVFLLKLDYDNAKEEKEKEDKNKDNRKNTVIAGLTIIAIVAILQSISPFIGK